MDTKQMAIHIQDYTGDRKLILDWKTGDSKAEEHIREMFVDLKAAGYRFYSVKRVLGVFKKKGEEVKMYDPSLGELIYEVPGEKDEVIDSLDIHESETDTQIKYEDHQKFNPKQDEIDHERDYVATKTLRAG